MYAVIFRAEIKMIDPPYSGMAARLRELAKDKYGCLEFTSLVEGHHEIAISYWESEEQIIAWKQNPEHMVAQELGRAKWYSSYKVQIVKLEREYAGGIEGISPVESSGT